MLKQLHLAAQYLAAFGINYIPKKEDDSHTNLGWDMENLQLVSRMSNNGIQLALDLIRFALIWKRSDQTLSTIELDSTSHEKILDWMNSGISKQEIGPKLDFSFHYHLPYGPIAEDFVFHLESVDDLKNHISLFNQAQKSFETFLDEQQLESEIRVWSHHLDLGLYTHVKAELYLGIGLAIPDSISDQPYYYVSGWKNRKSIDTSEYSKLTEGKWMSPIWHGGLLKTQVHLNPAIVGQFLRETKAEFIRHL